jgi:hypothetical protein
MSVCLRKKKTLLKFLGKRGDKVRVGRKKSCTWIL